jgi:NADH-quinone oxidoreductase subunit N
MNAKEILLAAPELWVLFMACVIPCVDVFLKEERRGLIHFLAIVTLVFAGILTWDQDYHANGMWTMTAFNDTFIRDAMGDVLKMFAYVVLIMVYTYSKHYLREFKLFRGDFYTLTMFALLGVMLLISANSLITIYLGLELISLPSYALVAFSRDSARGSESAMKYFILGSMASGMLLYGMSMVYGATGTLELGAISEAATRGDTPDILLTFGMVFMIVGIAFKLGVAPFHMWVPDVYHGAPAAVTLFISSVPKLAAFAMAYRVLAGGLPELHGDWQQMLMVLAGFSIIVGNLAAIMQTNIKRMLAYSTVSHMGFVLLGMLPGSAYGFGASMFYVIVYALMSAAGFGMVILLSSRGIEAENIDDFKGLNQRNSWYAAIMAMVMFSMAGVPVFVGFFAKWLVIKAALDAGLMGIAVLAVVFSVIGAFYYLRVVKTMYFDEAEIETRVESPTDFGAVISFNGILMIGLGLFASSLITVCMTSFGM